MEKVPDIFIFLGRFHPLAGHLPIGIISLAIFLEILSRKKGFERLAPVTRIIWLTGAWSAVVTIILGYLLSFSGGYDEETLKWHMWSAIVLAAVAFGISLLKKERKHGVTIAGARFQMAMVVAVSLLLVVTGHLGGSLTHGDDYLLEYAPGVVQKLAGRSVVDEPSRPRIVSLDSAELFQDAVQPILNSKCISCHNKTKQKGKLLLTSFENIMKGGEDGPVVAPGNLASSELYRRVTLPPEHKEFMPGEGKKPLTDSQIAILEWWIENGAPAKAKIASLPPDERMRKVAGDFFGLGKDKSEEIVASPADTASVNALVRQGYVIRPLAGGSNLLEAFLPEGVRENVQVGPLAGIKEQLVWLQMSHAGLTDRDLKLIGGLPNLLKLNVSGNRISDLGVRELGGLTRLQYLNLYATDVTDSAVTFLLKLPELKELYMGETKVSEGFIETLKSGKPTVKIIYKTPSQ